MEVSTDPSSSVSRQWSPADAPTTHTEGEPSITGLESTTTSKWVTLATDLGGDIVGYLIVAVVIWAVGPTIIPDASGYLLPALGTILPFLLLSFTCAGFYNLRFVHPARDMRQVFLVIVIMAGTAAVTVQFVTGRPDIAIFVGLSGLLGALVIPLCRVLANVLLSRFSWWGVPAVIVSSGDNGTQILDTLERWPEIGVRPVVLLNAAGDPENLDLTLGGPDWGPYLAQEFDIPYAIISMPELSHRDRAKLLARYSKFFDHVFLIPDGTDTPALWRTGQSGDGLRGYGVGNAASDVTMQVIKRVLDVVVASLVLACAAPLLLAIAILIRIDSEGPIFFRQERIGESGKIFTVLKFRSMYDDADDRLTHVLERNPERRREYERYHKLEDDPRVTPIGRILREYSLDELPQLLNVLRGEMSLIGPRAYMPSELPAMKGLEKVILQTPPGVTGLWQVSGRNQLSFEERVELDVHYVQNWSLWLDLYLLVRTIPTVLTGEGAT